MPGTIRAFSPVSWALAIVMTFAVTQVHGQTQAPSVFTSIDVPGATETDANDINDAGVIVGFYVDSAGVDHGWVRIGKTFQNIDVPGSVGTFAYGINDGEQIVGWYTDSGLVQHGFMLDKGKFTTIDVPGASLTNVWSINGTGAIAGTYQDGSGVFHGFEEANGSFFTIDIPGAIHTEIHGINALDDTAGIYYININGSEYENGFVRHPNGEHTTSFASFIDRIRDTKGTEVVGWYGENCCRLPLTPPFHGIVILNPHSFNSVDFPGAVDTFCRGVNKSGIIIGVVGSYTDTSGIIHGFVAKNAAAGLQHNSD
jgi:hypothetical protein